MKNIILFIISSLVLFLLFSCGSMDEHYKDLIKDGEIRYASAVEIKTFYSGDKKAKISFMVHDPNTSNVKAFWNNNTDSLSMDIEGVGEYSFDFPNLREQSYSFALYSYKQGATPSMGSFVTGRVYGDIYNSSILSRPITSATYITDNSVLSILWGAADTECLGTEVHYINEDGEESKAFIDSSAKGTAINHVKLGTEVKYRTLYMPEPFMVDTFKTVFLPVEDIIIK